MADMTDIELARECMAPFTLRGGGNVIPIRR
jgi:hypothetical protein